LKGRGGRPVASVAITVTVASVAITVTVASVAITVATARFRRRLVTVAA